MSWMSAPVPRNLRVRTAIQIAHQRLPLRIFLLLVGLSVLALLLLMAGGELLGVLRGVGAAALVAVAWLELKIWGRPCPAVVLLLLAHMRQRRRLLIQRPQITLAVPSDAPTRQPRWQAVRDA